ncbi:hypothetical protein OBBRIDRAFT_806901 [Obba rivulosa]|uniref:Uncharacterized protein n=1 Tax=Obba rivulosa TaxID=1052685 RepID=A0A8E2AN08_9APHY|nr:hypothetical protein OBBRIDRAFT_806901 [Obba rivulosa]
MESYWQTPASNPWGTVGYRGPYQDYVAPHSAAGSTPHHSWNPLPLFQSPDQYESDIIMTCDDDSETDGMSIDPTIRRYPWQLDNMPGWDLKAIRDYDNRLPIRLAMFMCTEKSSSLEDVDMEDVETLSNEHSTPYIRGEVMAEADVPVSVGARTTDEADLTELAHSQEIRHAPTRDVTSVHHDSADDGQGLTPEGDTSGIAADAVRNYPHINYDDCPRTYVEKLVNVCRMTQVGEQMGSIYPREVQCSWGQLSIFSRAFDVLDE